jgi:hypothetical protein
MKAHWNDATNLVACIVGKLVDFDSDGLNLDFHHGYRKIRQCRTLSPFFDMMEKESPKKKAAPPVPTDVRRDLRDIFIKHRNDVDLYSQRRASRPKAVTVIVLTKGLWTSNGTQAQDVEDAIVGFITELKKPIWASLNLGHRHFSLQFVQFGNDPHATRTIQDVRRRH